MAATAAGLLAGTVQALSPCKVDWQLGIVSIDARDASRADCLAALALRTGITMSGLENVRGQVTMAVSTPVIGDAIRKLAGDSSYTLVENDADHAGNDPRTQSVRFAGVGTGADAQPARDIMRNNLGPSALVENLESGVMEDRSPPAPTKQVGSRLTNARPGPDVQEHLEE